MRKQLFSYLVAVSAAIFIAFPSYGEDLVDIYQQAIVCDAKYLSARAGYLAAAEVLPQSRAKLLPNARVNANTTANSLDLRLVNSSANFPADSGNFNSRGYTVTLTQPLFDFGSWELFKQANSLVKQACALFGAASQDLVIRVAEAYFNVLLAQDNLRFIRAKKETTANQLRQIRERFKVGLDAISTLEESKAAYDRTVADEITAENNLDNSYEKLKQITGQDYCDLAILKVSLPLMTPAPCCSEQWVCTAKRQNLKLMASRYAIQAAKDKIKANFAGHLPVVNAVAIHEQQKGAFFDLFNYRQESAAIQVSLPLYSGGSVNSLVRQASYEFQQACADMQANFREASSITQQSFNNVVSGVSKIKADKQAVVSAQSALDSNQAAFKAGTRTIIDVLLAQQNLLSAQQIHAADQYAYLLDTLRLKQAAGTLSGCDLYCINQWLGYKDSEE